MEPQLFKDVVVQGQKMHSHVTTIVNSETHLLLSFASFTAWLHGEGVV